MSEILWGLLIYGTGHRSMGPVGSCLMGHHMPLGGVTSLGAFFLGRRGNGGTQWHVIMGPLIQRRLSLANAFFSNRAGQRTISTQSQRPLRSAMAVTVLMAGSASNMQDLWKFIPLQTIQYMLSFSTLLAGGGGGGGWLA